MLNPERAHTLGPRLIHNHQQHAGVFDVYKWLSSWYLVVPLTDKWFLYGYLLFGNSFI